MTKTFTRFLYVPFEPGDEERLETILAGHAPCPARERELGGKTLFELYPGPDVIDKLSSELREEGFHVRGGKVEERDWLSEWKKNWGTFRLCGKLVVVPSWLDYTPAEGELTLSLDPGMAFGTGKHPTTHRAARFIVKYARPGMSFLDVGTGSGILALCAAALGCGFLTALDTDPCAAAAAGDNFSKNDNSVLLYCGDVRSLKCFGRYDIVAANIIWEVIEEHLEGMTALLSSNGKLILGGILREKEAMLNRALNRLDLVVSDLEYDDEWLTAAVSKGDGK